MVKIAELITTISVIMVASSIALLILDRLSHPTIPAYILAGILLNRYVLQEELLGFAQLGIIFLVFIFGIKTEPKRLSTVAREGTLSAFIVTLVTGLGAYIVGLAMGLDTVNSIYFSIAASISSTLVGLELIKKDLRADLLHGRLAESIHLTQDMFAILFILISGSLTSESFINSLVTGLSVISFALIVRGYLIDTIMDFAEESQELTMLMALAILTTFIAITEIVNLSTVIGSFAAGLAMAKFPYNIESLDTINPLKDFFSAIFFVSLGSLLTTPNPASILLGTLLVLGTIIIKPLFTAFYLMHVGYDHRTSYLTGFSLDQVSEFALMIAIQAYIAGTMMESLFQAIVISAVITMILSSYTHRYSDELYKLISRYLEIEENGRKIEDRQDVDEMNKHVIIVGYGTQGQRIATDLERTKRNHVVIENDPEKVSEIKKSSKNYVFGDAVDEKTWKAARADKASLIVSTVPSHQLSEEIMNLDTDADKMLRTPEVEEAIDLLERGAFFVEVPDLLASEQLIEHIRHVKRDINAREELRRRNLLEIRKYLNN